MRDAAGTLVTGVGLPGAGKTSLFRQLSEVLSADAWLEPEESNWDRAVLQRDTYGHIGGLHWFRSQRVPNLIDARAKADSGKLVFLDTFYDKICSYYLGEPGMEWLISPTDPYFYNFLDTAKIDLKLLPDADLIVLIRVTENDWSQMLQTRGRKLDQAVDLSKTFRTQELFESAAISYAKDKDIPIFEFDNKFSSVEKSAAELSEALISKKLI